MWDTLLIHANAATMNTDSPQPYGLIADAAIAIRGDRIDWLDRSAALPGPAATLAREVIDCRGRLVTPGLIDCHTHLVYAGHRAREFEQRLQGASYAEIARAGGGINATVSATRAASEDELYHQSVPRLRNLMAEGVTTIEIKSGYGLNTADELKMLRVARRLGEHENVSVCTSFLGAHALPPEYAGRHDEYIDRVCKEMLPAVAEARLADAVDGFCEHIAFSPEQIERVFTAARQYGLAVKLHAEQLSDLKGAVMAARNGALSVDHLEYLAPADAACLAEYGTVAVLLPGAFYFLRETRLPPLAALREHGVSVAIASDANPGSSPGTSLLLMLNMACTFFRLTPQEALAGVTRCAARALGLAADRGVLATGMRADLVCWEVTEPAELAYRFGYNPCRQVFYQGRKVR